jgi:hypothetical protein
MLDLSGNSLQSAKPERGLPLDDAGSLTAWINRERKGLGGDVSAK